LWFFELPVTHGATMTIPDLIITIALLCGILWMLCRYFWQQIAKIFPEE
jgi:hypothetical protein